MTGRHGTWHYELRIAYNAGRYTTSSTSVSYELGLGITVVGNCDATSC
jgi:hypothetical protein